MDTKPTSSLGCHGCFYLSQQRGGSSGPFYGAWERKCNGLRLKPAMLTFDAVFSSQYLQMKERLCSHYLQMSLHSLAPARIPLQHPHTICK